MKKFRQRKKQKTGMFFTMDALVSALILIGGIILVAKAYVSEQPAYNLNYLSQDTLNVLGTLQVGEVNNSYIDELILNGKIKNLNNTLLEQIGEFWAAGDIDTAQNLTRNLTLELLPSHYGFGLWINNEPIYKRDISSAKHIATSKRLILGIEKTKPFNGFIAKAKATIIDRNTSRVIPFSPQGAGWKGGEGVITKYFNFTGDYILNDAEFWISAHIGKNNDDMIIEFNGLGGTCHFEVDDMDMIDEESIPGSGRGIFAHVRVPISCINIGLNNITLTLVNSAYNSHLHPGTFLILKYKDNDAVVKEIQKQYDKKYYFDDIISSGSGRNGVWNTVPFEIPYGATNVSVSVKVVGREINDYGGNICCQYQGFKCILKCKNADVRVYLNSDTPLIAEAHPSREEVFYLNPSDTSTHLQTGTNFVSVYISNYEDRRYGYQNVEIYSNPFNDPNNSSYIEVNYTYDPGFIGGAIKVTTTQQFGGIWETPKETNFTFPPEAVAVSDVFAHIVQIFSAKIKAEADINSPPANQLFLSPSMRAVPTNIMITEDTISSSSTVTNYFRVEDTFGEPRKISPNSTLEMGFYIRAYVSYGAVFSTQADANTDAQTRLENLLGQYISLENLEMINRTMTDVPSMWGPAAIEVRVWQ